MFELELSMFYLFVLILCVMGLLLGVLALVVLRKYNVSKQEEHFQESLDDLNEKLEKGLLSELHYRNCRYDLEQLYRSYFEKWRL